IVPATPLMLFAGRARGSLASCYLLNPLPRTTEEAVRAITDEVAPILLRRGGVGLSLQSFNRTPSGDCTRGIMAVLKALDSMTAAINSDSERPTGVCLRVRIASTGVYNAQFVALMPTVSSSQVTESSEGFSPTFTNMFSKVTISGELLRPNLPLMETLRRLFPRECARRDAVARLERAQWSVAAAFGELPAGHPLAKFKTAFEYDQELLIDMCA
nr:ribonucleotide reductase mutant [Suid alphaherpesvirus 1]